MSLAEEMEDRLQAAFSPLSLEIIDESEEHRGHSGYQEGGESHWRISMQSRVFADQTRIERHRSVHKALGQDIVGRIHALALNLSD
jgi:BolA protein